MKLSPSLASLWAKKDAYQGCEWWLPLVTHLTDTAKTITWLYDHWLSPAQRQLIAGNRSSTEAKKLLAFVGFFHDFGKATPDFQAKTSYHHDQQLDHDIIEKLLHNGFTDLADFNRADEIRRKSPHAIAGEALLEVHGLCEAIGAILGGHHGIPAHKNFDAVQGQLEPYTSNYFGDEKNVEAKEHWQAVYDELITYGLHYTSYQSLSDVPAVTQLQAVIIEGLLIMADWLASSEFLGHKPLFPLIPLEKGFNDIDEDERFNHAMKIWQGDDRWQPQPTKDVDQLFKERWGFAPHKTQRKMVETIAKIKDPGLIIVEASCGTGKTETALASTEELAAKTQHDGLLIGLPTQATTNAMYGRVEGWLDRLSSQQEAKLDLGLLHGKAKLNKRAQSLPEAHNVDGDHGAVVTNSWFSGKKSILVDFSVATIDHLLMMSLKQKHLFLRHLAMSGKVIVIDEVHAYDTFVSSYLRRTLIWLGAYHVPVIALSATLPAQKRQQLIKAYARGKFRHAPKWPAEANNLAYPLLTYLDGDQAYHETDFPHPAPQAIQINHLNSDQDLIKQIKQSLQDGGTAGVIVSTVKRAQELAQKLADMPTLLLHSSFLGPDRTYLENKLVGMIGKGGKRPEKLVVIGTQVLEQSLDIDFDVLFTDIAPVDLLIQRIGRLHRHRVLRPACLQRPQVYITGAKSLGDYGLNSYIYEDYYLTKTDYFLPAELKLPDDTAPLIQKVYDPGDDDEVPFSGIKKLHHELELKLSKKKTAAKTYQIDNPRTADTLHGWLDNDKNDADTNEAVAQATVRDIQPTIEVVLIVQDHDGHYWLADHRGGQPLGTVSGEQVSEETIRLPYAVCSHGNLADLTDQLKAQTKQAFPNWQNSIWLRNTLALVLDTDLATEFNGYRLQYSPQVGMTYEKIHGKK